MTNAIRVFAKQCARVPPFASVGGATGAPEMDSATAAAMCRGLAKHPYYAARFMWTHDMQAGEWIRIELQRKAMELAQTKWKHEKSWPVWNEYIKARHGRSASLVFADMVVLEAARLSLLDSVEKKMAYLQIESESTWHRHFRKKYNAVASYLDAWVGDAFAHVMNEQRED